MKKIILFILTVTNTLLIQANDKNKSLTDTLHLMKDKQGKSIDIYIERGTEFNHPTYAIWIEDPNGNYLQDLFVTKSVATGFYGHVTRKDGKWLPGPKQIESALPYWYHRINPGKTNMRTIPTQENPVPDAYTGATSKNNVYIRSRLDQNYNQPIVIVFEINQTWDWNEYWTNNKYPESKAYLESAQPALVYKSKAIDLLSENQIVELLPIGHSHPQGENGEINSDLTTITTALKIIGKIQIMLK